MLRLPALAALLLLLPIGSAPTPPAVGDGPHFTPDGRLEKPRNYREWIFLTSGLDMSYDQTAADPKMSIFNNVFVNPAAYRVFQQTGQWPDGTAIVLENRGAEGSRSINKRGRTQSTELMGLEVHVKQTQAGWSFYAFDGEAPAKRLDQTANCYGCHEQHAAVDTTFVQFYPTLQAAAKAHGTFSKAYRAELSAAK